MNRQKDARRTALADKIARRWRTKRGDAVLSYMTACVEYAMSPDARWETAEPDPVSGHPIADETTEAADERR